MNPLWILLIGVAVVVGGILGLRLHAFLALMAGAVVVAALKPQADQSIGPRIAAGFGKTAQDIGILIAMAAILGQALLESGAAERIVLSLQNLLGQRRASLAFLISGFILGGLVLSDTTFYLLIPIAQVMRVRSGRDYTLYIMSIVAGAVMTHSLIPPAAGPVMVARALDLNLATMILGGAIIGAIASSSGYLYACWANRNWNIPLRGAVGVSQAELERISSRDPRALPPLWLAVAPVIVPVLLIAAGAIFGKKHPALATWGDRNLAMMIAAAIGLLMVWTRPQTATGTLSSAMVGKALASGGVMILIISAGGAFGAVVQQTGVAAELQHMLPQSKLALLPLAWLVTAAVRTAQGSAIVAMVTAIGIVAPIAAGGHLGFHPVYLALAIGCGSKPFQWMNDAGFWIIDRMSGFTEAETLKTVSVMTAIMGVTGLLATMLGAWLLPLR